MDSIPWVRCAIFYIFYLLFAFVCSSINIKTRSSPLCKFAQVNPIISQMIAKLAKLVDTIIDERDRLNKLYFTRHVGYTERIKPAKYALQDHRHCSLLMMILLQKIARQAPKQRCKCIFFKTVNIHRTSLFICATSSPPSRNQQLKSIFINNVDYSAQPSLITIEYSQYGRTSQNTERIKQS